MGNAAQCCVKRDSEEEAFASIGSAKAMRCESWHSLPEVTEEQWHFFQRLDEVAEADGVQNQEGIENGESKALLPLKRRSTGEGGKFERGSSDLSVVDRRQSWVRLRRPMSVVPEEASHLCTINKKPSGSPMTKSENAAYIHMVEDFRRKVRQAWEEKLKKPEQLEVKTRQHLEEGCPELEEWTDDETCLRMLRAVVGDEKIAGTMLVKAIECRVRDRDLYMTLTCDVHCDMRIIGRDSEHRPVVYMCAKSQVKSIKECAAQILLALEAAVRLSEGAGNGKILFIADMHGFSASLNMDPFTLKDLGGTFGTVFADRFAYIMIVDFSFVAQGMWSVCKPLISERTHKKISFVGIKKAKEICKERLSVPTFDRIVSSFDINRAKGITDKEREEHARRTAICDVPLGLLRSPELAG
mmetsp:Transcript_60208/g.127545  ORF Transcript_60208/g.127545 Transcript_60208/m.127545 type:complete len:413 (+) Transcript_60208:158-1396(+)